MCAFLFGMDQKEPRRFAAVLAEKGYQAVVCAPEAAQIDALNGAGLEAYLCAGAFPLSDGGDPCIDLDGEKRPWFSSACPCHEAGQQAALRRIAALAATPGIRGVYLDGARFASPATYEGSPAFFTCFCPHCQQKALEMGLDLEAGRRQLAALRAGERKTYPPILAAFRAEVVARFVQKFVDVVHGVNPLLEANAFVFAPSLGPLVGQTPATFSPLDALSPMLYRAYPAAYGTACLNHEYHALNEMFGPDGARELTGVCPPPNVLRAGFPPAFLTAETAAARKQFSGRLEPIIQWQDPLLGESIQAVARGGAQGVGLFAYGGQGAEALPDFAGLREEA